MKSKLHYLQKILLLLPHINFWMLPIIFFTKSIPVHFFNPPMKLFMGDIGDLYVFNEVLLEDIYQKHKKVSQDDIVIDVGTGLGDFSILASQKAEKVFSYDPDEFRINLARKNVKLNNVHNIDLIQKSVKSLDDVFEENKIKHCNFLKMDCEGWEYPIMRNTSDKVLSHVEFIAMEAHLLDESMRREYSRLKKRLKENNFIFIEERVSNFPDLRFLYAQYKKVA